MPSNKPIKLVYRQDGLVSKQWSSVEFPGVSEVAMIKLLDVCSVASYGYEGKDMVDKNYRNAFKLEPGNFITSFQLSATPILQEIQSIVPTVVGLKAELYKLNIYARGGFFKAHVDTPRSENMFGSLVVCLPTQFTGGELIVRHHKEEIKYDWSSTASDTSSTLHWAAFFSDVIHEVLPVSEGYRVTLTYNLSYQSKASDLTFDVKTCSFYKLLQATLSNPVFMCDGGVLGFNSHYSYVFDTQWADLLAPINTTKDKADTIEQLNKKVSCSIFIQLNEDVQVRILKDLGIEDVNCKQILDALPLNFPILKGADYVVVESAKSLDLPICVTAFLSNNRCDRNFEYILNDFSQRIYEENCLGGLSYGHQLQPFELFGKAIYRCKSQDITWCQELSFRQPAGASMYHGNKASVDLWYKSAAILIIIPKWGEYRQKLKAINTGESYGPTNAIEIDDGTVKDFGDIIQNYGDIIQEETQKMDIKFKELLDNEHVKEVEGLVNVLEKMQVKLNSDDFPVSKRAHYMYCIKDDLNDLKRIVESESRSVARLHNILQMLRSTYRQFK